MFWIGISLLSRVFFAAANVFDSHFRHATFKNAVAQNFCCTVYSLFIIPALFLIVHPHLPDARLWPWIILSGVLMNLYLLPYYEAMKWGDSSSITSLFTLSRVFTPLMAFLLIGERLSFRQYLGFGVVLAGAFFLSFDRKALKFALKPFLLMVASGFMAALSNVASKNVYNYMPWQDVFFYIIAIATLTAFMPYAIPALRPGIDAGMRQFPSYARLMALAVIVATSGSVLFNYALSLTYASYVSMIGMFQPFFVMGISYAAYKLGWLSAKESFHPHDITQKIIAFVIMTGGVFLTLWGKA